MKFAKLAAAAAALAIVPATAYAQDAAPAAAPAAVEVTQGATVTGNDGNAIGTVSQVSADSAVVNTGTHDVPLPLNAFGTDAAGENAECFHLHRLADSFGATLLPLIRKQLLPIDVCLRTMDDKACL